MSNLQTKYFTTDVSMCNDKEKELYRKINYFGYQLSTDDVTPSCTHLICVQDRVIASQRTMCAMLYGLKIVPVSLINDSFQCGSWLNEEKYTGKLNRMYKNIDRNIFKKKMFVYSRNKFRTGGFKKVLTSGSANICTEEEIRLNVKVPDFCLSDECTFNDVTKLVPESIPILSLDYVRDCMFYNHNPADLHKHSLRANKKYYIAERTPSKLNQQRKRIQTPIKSIVPMAENMDDIQIVYENITPKIGSSHKPIEIMDTDDPPENNKSHNGAGESHQVHCSSNESYYHNIPHNLLKKLTFESDLLACKSNPDTSRTTKHPLQNEEFEFIFTSWTTLLAKSSGLLKYAGNLSSADSKCYNFTVLNQDDMKLCSLGLLMKKNSITSVREGRYKKLRIDTEYDISPEASIRIAHAFHWTKVRITEVTLPNASFVGKQLAAFVFQTSSRSFLGTVLSMFQKILHLHPPTCKKMRQYYFDILVEAAKTNSTTNPNPWDFISKLISQELWIKKAKYFEIAFSPLQFILPMFKYDIFYFNQNPCNIISLLSYKVFWSKFADNPSLRNNVVVEVIEHFCNSAEASYTCQNNVTNVLSILLEIIFKWRHQSLPLELCQWPLNSKWSSVSSEILLKFKEHKNLIRLLPVIKLISVPWQRMLLYITFYRAYKPEVTFGNIDIITLMKLLTTAVQNCSKEPLESHKLHLEILSLMINAYLHGMGLFHLRKNRSTKLNKILQTGCGINFSTCDDKQTNVYFQTLTTEYVNASKIKMSLQRLSGPSLTQCCHLSDMSFVEGF